MYDDKKKKALKQLTAQDGKAFNQTDMNHFDLERGRNLAKGQLDKDTFKVAGDQSMADVTEPRTRVRGTGTERIDTKQMAPMSDIDDYSARQADLNRRQLLKSTARAAADAGDTDTLRKLKTIVQKLGKGAKQAAKVVPGIGAVMALAGAEDASAAVPGLDQAGPVGMSPEAEDQMMAEIQARKDYGQSPAAKDRARALAKLLKEQG